MGEKIIFFDITSPGILIWNAGACPVKADESVFGDFSDLL